jgi:hypothetical protein
MCAHGRGKDLHRLAARVLGTKGPFIRASYASSLARSADWMRTITLHCLSQLSCLRQRPT